MVHETVTVASSGHMQAKHHLIPPLTLAKMLWEACDVAFGQPFQFLIHFLPLYVGENAVHPKHNLNLQFQGQHSAKRIFWIHQPFAVHDDSAKNESGLSAARRLINPHPGPITHSRQDFFLWTKSVPMGGGGGEPPKPYTVLSSTLSPT